MAHHVMGAGFAVTVFDVSPQAMAQAVAEGARPSATAAELAGKSDVVLTVLPDAAAVEQAMLGEAGIAAGIRPGAVVVEMSTISPSLTRRLALAIQARGAHYLDCPISGGVPGAEQGTLTLMVGGDPAVLEMCRDALEPMAGGIYHMGEIGAGLTTKLINQLLTMTQTVLVTEALAMGARAGMNLTTLHELICKSSGRSWCWEHRIPRILKQAADAWVTVDICHKDLGLAKALGEELGFRCSWPGARSRCSRSPRRCTSENGTCPRWGGCTSRCWAWRCAPGKRTDGRAISLQAGAGTAMGKAAYQVVLIHGTSTVIAVMEEAIRAIDSRIGVLHIVDEPLLKDLLAVGHITPDIRWRFTQLVVEGARIQPDLIVVTGSSFSPCVDFARETVSVPVLKVDERMAQEAAAFGRRLAVVATERTTIGPTSSLLEQQAGKLGKSLELDVILCEGAMALLRQGQPALHDSRVLECLKERGALNVDAIVLAQVSLARVQPQVETLTGKRVFSSPSTAARMVKELLD